MPGGPYVARGPDVALACYRGTSLKEKVTNIEMKKVLNKLHSYFFENERCHPKNRLANLSHYIIFHKVKIFVRIKSFSLPLQIVFFLRSDKVFLLRVTSLVLCAHSLSCGSVKFIYFSCSDIFQF